MSSDSKDVHHYVLQLINPEQVAYIPYLYLLTLLKDDDDTVANNTLYITYPSERLSSHRAHQVPRDMSGSRTRSMALVWNGCGVDTGDRQCLPDAVSSDLEHTLQQSSVQCASIIAMRRVTY